LEPAVAVPGEEDESVSREKSLLVGLSGTWAAAGVALLVPSAQGAFVSADAAPLAGALALTAVSLGALLIRRRVAWRPRLALSCLAIGLAWAAFLAHHRLLAERREAIESPAKQELVGRPAPVLQWSDGFNLPAAAASGLPAAGQLTIVDFWATWCSPCVVHMPKLAQFHRQRNSQGLQVVGVTTFYGEDRSQAGKSAELREIESFLKEHQIGYPVVVAGDERNHKAFRVSALPTSILVDGSGAVLDYGVGLDGSAAELARAGGLLGR
jgi:thiol-disulfide isomerase/thioredoxin